MEETNVKLVRDYIKLDKIPDMVANPTDIDIRLSEIKSDNNYVIYKNVPIKDIDIVITNSRRIDEPGEKIENMKTLGFYLDEKNEEENYTLKQLLKNASIDDIKQIDKTQKLFAKEKPVTIKYHKDYLWQIFYIKRTDKYYMIVPVQETEQQAFLYLLKKKISGNKGSIYVPICNGTYENTIIEQSKIKKMETALNYFTNNWPTIYESEDKNNEKVISIIGKLNIYENISSDYKMEYTNKDEIKKFYTLIDTLFYIQTELSGFFKLNLFLDETGSIHFYYNNMELTIDNLKEFYGEEIKRNVKSINEVEKIQTGLLNKLNRLRIQEKKLNSELMYKQKQISTYLECKKTFFGKVKYFFRYGKKTKITSNLNETPEEEVNIEKPRIDNNNYNNDIDDLIYVCKQLKSKTILAATTRMDIQNLIIKIDILKKKIENANAYIQEIESHKKSIFEFWKYTNKDEKAQLTQAEIAKEGNKPTIEKIFNVDEDLNDFSKKQDLLQREKLSDAEKNSILLAKTIILSDINNIINLGKTTSEIFEKIKDKENLVNINENILEHREKVKSIENILGVSKNSTFDEYIQILRKNIKYMEHAFEKSTIDISLPTYCLEAPENRILKLEINPKKLLNMDNEVVLYRINIKNGMNVIPFSNSIFFNNRNKTLPLGMDYSTEVLADLREANIIKVKDSINHIIDLNNNKVTKLHVSEYNI